MGERHKTKYVLLRNGPKTYVRRHIDANIAGLIVDLNELGAFTMNCCLANCGNWCTRRHRFLYKKPYRGSILYVYQTPKACKESVWITFDSATSAETFMNAASDPSDDEALADQITGAGKAAGKDTKTWVWKVMSVDVNDHRWMEPGRNGWRGKRVGPPVYEFICNVVFPHAHLEMVTERVRKKAEKKRGKQKAG